MTALAEAFAKSGVRPEDAVLDIAIAKYLNSGGTIDGAIRRVNVAAERVSGMGHVLGAYDGPINPAQTRQQVEGERGRGSLSGSAQTGNASPPSFSSGGEGRASRADSGRSLGALPVREPTPQQRLISARNARVVAVTIMDTLKIDGRPVGDWTVAEARQAGRLKTREGHILVAASRMVANAAGNELIRSVVKPAEMQKIIQKAAEVADAV